MFRYCEPKSIRKMRVQVWLMCCWSLGSWSMTSFLETICAHLLLGKIFRWIWVCHLYIQPLGLYSAHLTFGSFGKECQQRLINAQISELVHQNITQTMNSIISTAALALDFACLSAHELCGSLSVSPRPTLYRIGLSISGRHWIWGKRVTWTTVAMGDMDDMIPTSSTKTMTAAAPASLRTSGRAGQQSSDRWQGCQALRAWQKPSSADAFGSEFISITSIISNNTMWNCEYSQMMYYVRVRGNRSGPRKQPPHSWQLWSTTTPAPPHHGRGRLRWLADLVGQVKASHPYLPSSSVPDFMVGTAHGRPVGKTLGGALLATHSGGTWH